MSRILALAVLSLLTGCSTVNHLVQTPLRWVGLADSAAPGIDQARLAKHIETLASDRFEGRQPGTPGETHSVNYLTEAFAAAGAEPGHPDGGYVQNVPLVGLTAQIDVGMQINGKPLPLTLQSDVVASTRRVEKLVRVRKSPLVFVGYGVQAPEYDWDDYKGMDMRGKTLLMLVNDPQIPDPAATDGLDAQRFKGRAMTYYGRWTYKYEIAAKLGAAAVLVIHETGPAGYPWGVVSDGMDQEHFTLDAANGNSDKVAVNGWIRDTTVRRLMSAAGLDFDQLKAAAVRDDFTPVSLPGQASFQIRNRIRKVQSANVVARIEGSQKPDELIVFTAHWDHLGRDRSLNGDQIFNGAVDNATGTAGLIELAHAFAANPTERSVLLLAVTAEEQGLLGAAHYAANPLYPLSQTVANINMDAMNVWGRTEDVVLVGKGQNTLEDDLAAAAHGQGRTVVDERTPEKGFYFRSDHFEFAKRGVPALYARSGTRFVGRDADFGARMQQQYIANDYHQVSDEVKDDWDLSGLVQDLQLLEAVARRVAAAPGTPQWKAGSEFSRPATRHP